GASTASFFYGDTKAGTPTISAASAGLTTASQQETITAGAAAAFTVSGYPAAPTAGSSNSFAVAAIDAFGNVATGYTGTAHFASSDSQAVVPANTTLTNGSGAFSATLKTAGSQSLTATDTATSSITGSQTGINVK